MSTGSTAASVKAKYHGALAGARDVLQQFSDNEKNWNLHMKQADKQDEVKQVAPLVKGFATLVNNTLKEAKAFEKVTMDAKQMQALTVEQVKTRLTVFLGMCKKVSEAGLKLQAMLKKVKCDYWKPTPAKLMSLDKDITSFTTAALNELKIAVGQIK
jgi:hypothetical protein